MRTRTQARLNHPMFGDSVGVPKDTGASALLMQIQRTAPNDRMLLSKVKEKMTRPVRGVGARTWTQRNAKTHAWDALEVPLL
jgi:hypothetical protein